MYVFWTIYSESASKKPLVSGVWDIFFKITSFFKKTTRRRQYHQSKLNLGDYPVAYVEYPVEKINKFAKTHFYYQFDAKLGQIVPMLVIRLFNQTPGSEQRDFYIKLPIYRPWWLICYGTCL